MSPQLTSQGMVLATTAAMAVSGTVILLALRLHHRTTLPSDPRFHPSREVLLRPCISSSSDEQRRSSGVSMSKKKKKRVRFADDVAEDPSMVVYSSSTPDYGEDNNRSGGDVSTSSGDKVRGIQANRMALYNGILRDRVIQRMAYSY